MANCPCGRSALARGLCSSHYARWRRTGRARIDDAIGYPDLDTRFDAGVDRSGGTDACWPWLGARTKPGGYGRISYGRRRSVLAHRYAVLGLTQSDLAVLHRCDNPPCVNPAHLFLGSLADNNADRSAKGRSATWRRWPHAKLNPDRVGEIRARYGTGRETQQRIADDMGISQALVSQVVRGRTKIV